jgi:phosphatidylglycerol:prolipoprotein diacylglycerol transferase
MELFGEEIAPFDLLVTLAIVGGVITGYRRARQVGVDPGIILDVTLWAVLPGFIGSHLYSMLFYFPERVAEDPWRLLYFWNEMSSFGGFIGGALGVIAFFKLKRLPLWAYSDPVIYGFTFGWVFGRLGCSTAHDHRGLPTDFFLALEMPALDGYPAGPRHDLGFYELLWACAVMGSFFALRKRPHFAGWHPVVFVLTYMPLRFGFDFLRVTDRTYAGLTAAQFAAIGIFGVGVWWWWYLRRRGEILVADGRPHVFPGAGAEGQAT